MAEAERDQNRVTTIIAVSSVDEATPINVWADPATHELLVQTSLTELPDTAAGDLAAINAALAGTLTVSGSVTANAGTNLNTSGLLTEATFTGRAGEVQATPTANTILGRLKGINDAQLPDSHNVTVDNASIPVTGTFWQATQPVSIAQDVMLGSDFSNVFGAASLVSATPAVKVEEQGTVTVDLGVNNDVVVTATDLDIRDLTSASDSILAYGSDDGGTTKRVIKTDVTGAVQVDIETMPTTTLTADQNVQARGYGWIGAAWRKNPLQNGISGQIVGDYSNLSAVAGTNNLTGADVPAGEIWMLRQAGIVNENTGIVYGSIRLSAGGTTLTIKEQAPMTTDRWLFWEGDILMIEGDNLIGNFQGCTLNDNIYLRYLAVRVDIDQ